MWAPLRGFKYGPRSLICALDRTSGERRDSGAAYPTFAVQGRRGSGARGLGYYREFSN